LPDKPSLQDLLEVQRHFDLPSPALVEKDWYVVKALAAINTAEVKPFRLVFSGGTALSRAHRLTRRMSEDIDLKIVSDEPRSRAELRKLRGTVTSALLGAGFAFDPENAAHRDSGNAHMPTGLHDGHSELRSFKRPRIAILETVSRNLAKARAFESQSQNERVGPHARYPVPFQRPYRISM
jgi:predicted nucleotidyltransferase component of viral defense system